MAKITWWLRIVGVFYLFLAVASAWVIFVIPNLFGSMFPYSANELSLCAFCDAWLIVVLEMGALGVICYLVHEARQKTESLC